MRAPKHLWSGDWERESAAVSDELASLEELPRVAAEPAAAAPDAPDAPAAGSRAAVARPGFRAPSRRVRRMLAITVAALTVLGGVAYGLDALITSPGGSNSPRAAPLGPPGPAGSTPPPVVPSPGGPSGGPSAGGPSQAMWWLGMQIETYATGGVVIVTVPAGSLGEAAGLEPGDVIVQIGNQSVSSAADIEKAVAGLRVGQIVGIEVSRGSTLFKTSAILGAPPSSHP